MFFLRLDFWASQYIIRLESQSICLDDSGTPLSNVNVRRASPNFCNLSGYLSPPTRLPPIAGSQLLARAIVGLYYLYNTTYIIDLNSIIYRSSPGFEPGSPGPKAAILPLCYASLTTFTILLFTTITKKLFQDQGPILKNNLSLWLI